MTIESTVVEAVGLTRIHPAGKTSVRSLDTVSVTAQSSVPTTVPSGWNWGNPAQYAVRVSPLAAVKI